MLSTYLVSMLQSYNMIDLFYAFYNCYVIGQE
jgi:hypothetical protein